MVFDDVLLEKHNTPVNRIMSEEDEATLIVSNFSSKLFHAPRPNNQREREFHLSVFAKT